jgi:hypothetical protein
MPRGTLAQPRRVKPAPESEGSELSSIDVVFFLGRGDHNFFTSVLAQIELKKKTRLTGLPNSIFLVGSEKF